MTTNTSAKSTLMSFFLLVCVLVMIICSYLETGLEPMPITIQYPKVRPFLPKRAMIATTSKANQSLVPTRPFPTTSITLNNGSDVPHQYACQPLQRVVYIKTHKTGSTTLASIFERYAYLRNLDVAVPPIKRNHVLSDFGLFQTSMTIKIKKRNRTDFDMIVNHVRYNRGQMDIAVPRAKYISIIRHPVAQFESFFGYFEFPRRLHINTSDPFETFMSDVKGFYAKKVFQWPRIRNGQLYDFGFDHKYDENQTKIKEKIKELAREIDLVMINEYYDESLILLRKMMCWDYEDILYISNGVRSQSHRYPITEETEQRILSWNAGDIMLYDHFNETFWKKVHDYGDSFGLDLAHFRALQRDVKDECIKEDATNKHDKREDKFVVKQNATTFCNDLLRADVPYTRLLKKAIVGRYR
ncbi:galactosylceramide sulfotransferase-like [Diadema antillarum]|uniref:galactosylceramide sulfotransferase-like n=1 Tax=Diadema antillarum TaxID=105358 RepID=UPI003A885FCF